jgi:hypothetical protein
VGAVRERAWKPALVGALVFVAAGAPPWVGLFSGRGIGDMYLFRMYGHRMQDGLLPYRDFYFDWAPGSVPPVFWPALPRGSYYDWFHVFLAVYAIAALAAVAVTLVLLGARGLRLYGAVAAAAAVPFALGSIAINSLDYWPALFTAAGLATLVAGRDRTAFGLLGFAIAAKVYPVVILPVAVIYLWRRRGRAAATRALAWCIGVIIVVAAPFAILGHGGLGYSTYTQFKRGLQMESLGASILMALDHVGLYDAHVVVGRPYSLDVAGGTAAAVGAAFTVVLIAALLAVYAAYAAGRDTAQRLVTAAAAAVAAYVAFNRVLSPQYIVWLVPLVPLVAGVPGIAGTALLFGAGAMTMTWFPGRFWHLVAVSPVSWCVLVRNLLLVLVFAAVVTPLVRTMERPFAAVVTRSWAAASRRGIARARAH